MSRFNRLSRFCTAVAGLCLLGTSAASAAITLRQKASSSTSSGTTLTAAFPSAVTAGNLIAVSVSAWPNLPTSVTDSNGNSYVLLGSTRTTGSSSAALFYAKNVVGGTDTLTFTAAGTNGQL
jgi:hypothetical protein